MIYICDKHHMFRQGNLVRSESGQDKRHGTETENWREQESMEKNEKTQKRDTYMRHFERRFIREVTTNADAILSLTCCWKMDWPLSVQIRAVRLVGPSDRCFACNLQPNNIVSPTPVTKLECA